AHLSFYGLESRLSTTLVSRDDALKRHQNKCQALPTLARWQTDRISALLDLLHIPEQSWARLYSHRAESRKIVLLCILAAWPWWKSMSSDEEQSLTAQMVYEWLNASYEGPSVPLPTLLPDVRRVLDGSSTDDVFGERSFAPATTAGQQAYTTMQYEFRRPTNSDLDQLRGIQPWAASDITTSDLPPVKLLYEARQDFDALPFESPNLPRLLSLVRGDQLVLLHSPPAMDWRMVERNRDGASGWVWMRCLRLLRHESMQSRPSHQLPIHHQLAGSSSLPHLHPPKAHEVPAASRATPHSRTNSVPVIAGHDPLAGPQLRVDEALGAVPTYPILPTAHDQGVAGPEHPNSDHEAERSSDGPNDTQRVGPEGAESDFEADMSSDDPNDTQRVGPEDGDSDFEADGPHDPTKNAQRVGPEDADSDLDA
ncbi:hypothetical protein AC578_7061, partial [Pseudocercospora eumusae]